jgi:hypothetical protein
MKGAQQEYCLSSLESALARRVIARVLIGVLRGVSYKKRRE